MPKNKIILLCSLLFLESILAFTTIVRENSTNFNDLCSSGKTCICDGSNRNCSELSNIALSDAFRSLSLNPTVENIAIDQCHDDSSGNLLIFEWLKNASASLQRFSLSNCHLERVILAKNLSDIDQLQFSDLVTIDLSGNRLRTFPWNNFDEIFPALIELVLRDNLFKTIDLSYDDQNSTNRLFDQLEILDLSGNRFAMIPRSILSRNLLRLNLSRNSIREIRFEDFSETENLEVLDLSHNRLESIQPDSFLKLRKLQKLLLNNNRLSLSPDNRRVFSGLINLNYLDLSHNQIDRLEIDQSWRWTIALETLILDQNPLRGFVGVEFPRELARLRILSITSTYLYYFDLESLSNLINLRELRLRDNRQLRACVGNLRDHAPALRVLDLSNCQLNQLRADFFENTTESGTKLKEIVLIGNPWAICDCRMNQWLPRLQSIATVLRLTMDNITATPCTNQTDKSAIAAPSAEHSFECDIGVSKESGTIERTTHGSEIILDCGAYGDPAPNIRWEHVITNRILGQWPSENRTDLDESQTYSVLPGGLLLVRRTTGREVGPYRCVVENKYGNATSIILLRLDYSSWWDMKLYSILCGIITAIGFFILNIIYVGIRRTIIWRISKLEQTSRMRMLLEAMEKYRQRQMENLHDKYTNRMNLIRDNYHGQVEQMRKSYCSQADRFRDYRAAQMESMSHHIDSIRDNYNWQANRVREYGSRQMERLWESYQRQVNRVRAFSLQQRLRLMRQYKINQRYWNKIFESVNIETNGTSATHNGHIRVVIPPEMIQLPDLPPPEMAGDDDAMMLDGFVMNDLTPGTSKAAASRSSKLFDDTLTSLIMNKVMKDDIEIDVRDVMLPDDDDDTDGCSSYHSIPGGDDDEDIQQMEAEIMSQIDIDTRDAMRCGTDDRVMVVDETDDDDEDRDQHIPPIIAQRASSRH